MAKAAVIEKQLDTAPPEKKKRRIKAVGACATSSKQTKPNRLITAKFPEKIEQLIIDSYNKSRKSWVENGLVPPL